MLEVALKIEFFDDEDGVNAWHVWRFFEDNFDNVNLAGARL